VSKRRATTSEEPGTAPVGCGVQVCGQSVWGASETPALQVVGARNLTILHSWHAPRRFGMGVPQQGARGRSSSFRGRFLLLLCSLCSLCSLLSTCFCFGDSSTCHTSPLTSTQPPHLSALCSPFQRESIEKTCSLKTYSPCSLSSSWWVYSHSRRTQLS
jgi:hypothetical protein